MLCRNFAAGRAGPNFRAGSSFFIYNRFLTVYNSYNCRQERADTCHSYMFIRI